MSDDAEGERLMNVLRTTMRLLDLSNPEPAPVRAVELTSGEIDRRIREAVRRAFQELAAASYPADGQRFFLFTDQEHLRRDRVLTHQWQTARVSLSGCWRDRIAVWPVRPIWRESP